jgi:thioredoxin 1
LTTSRKEYRGSVAFAKVNADDEPVLAGRWGVQAIPTLMLFRRGRPVDRVVGVLPREALRLRLLRALEPSDPAEERE